MSLTHMVHTPNTQRVRAAEVGGTRQQELNAKEGTAEEMASHQGAWI